MSWESVKKYQIKNYYELCLQEQIKHRSSHNKDDDPDYRKHNFQIQGFEKSHRKRKKILKYETFKSIATAPEVNSEVHWRKLFERVYFWADDESPPDRLSRFWWHWNICIESFAKVKSSTLLLEVW